MIEIAFVFTFFLLCLAVFILLPILLVVKAAQLLFGPVVKEVHSAVKEVQEHKWRHLDAPERERMVRVEQGWRTIGRVLGAGCCAVGAVLMFPTPAVGILGMAAYRLLKPIRQEMRDACAYRSTGVPDEPPYSSGDIGDL